MLFRSHISLIKNISISVNVSRTYIFNEGYVDKLIHLVKACNVNPEQVEIEITETTALNHKEELIKILNQLKSYHFKVALDDFGSGYSSLNILKDLPIDVVKIDQEFFRTNDYTHTRSHIIIEEIITIMSFKKLFLFNRFHSLGYNFKV